MAHYQILKRHMVRGSVRYKFALWADEQDRLDGLAGLKVTDVVFDTYKRVGTIYSTPVLRAKPGTLRDDLPVTQFRRADTGEWADKDEWTRAGGLHEQGIEQATRSVTYSMADANFRVRQWFSMYAARFAEALVRERPGRDDWAKRRDTADDRLERLDKDVKRLPVGALVLPRYFND